MLLGLLGLLLGLVHLPDDLLLVVDNLLVLLGTPGRLVAMRSGERSGVVSGLSLGLVGLGLESIGFGGIGDVVGEGSLVLGIKTLVGVLRADFESLTGLGVAWC